jgi:hypothetical protein
VRVSFSTSLSRRANALRSPDRIDSIFGFTIAYLEV